MMEDLDELEKQAYGEILARLPGVHDFEDKVLGVIAELRERREETYLKSDCICPDTAVDALCPLHTWHLDRAPPRLELDKLRAEVAELREKASHGRCEWLCMGCGNHDRDHARSPKAPA